MRACIGHVLIRWCAKILVATSPRNSTAAITVAPVGQWGIAVPMTPFFRERAFDPEAIRVMTLAFTDVCSRLGLVDKSDGATQLVAKKIIETAERGERDPARMVSAVLTHFAH